MRRVKAMTKNSGSTSTTGDAKMARQDPSRPVYTQSELAEMEVLQAKVNVARALLRRRIVLGLTQYEVAARAGTKQSRVSELEAMKGNPRFDTLDRVSRALDLVIDLLPRTTRISSGQDLMPEGYSRSETNTVTRVVGSRRVAWLGPCVPA